MKNKRKTGGFEYYLEPEKISEYSKWPAEEKLRWLSAFNELRKYYPKEIIESHEKFRRGEI
ncbi:MAG: hypothetical protein ABIH89_01445 [Elusimicrobiota bacterium]